MLVDEGKDFREVRVDQWVVYEVWWVEVWRKDVMFGEVWDDYVEMCKFFWGVLYYCDYF